MVVVAVTSSVVKGRRKNNYNFVVEHPSFPNLAQSQPETMNKNILKNLSDNADSNLLKKQETLTTNTIKERVNKTKVVLSGKENVIHSGFNCNKCKATFTTKYHLNKHMKAHSQAKNKFKCFPCNKTFITKIGLSQHKEKSHTLTNKTSRIQKSNTKQNIDNSIPNKQNKSAVVGNLAEMFSSMDKGVIEMVVDQFSTMEGSMNALLALAATDPAQPKISLPQGRIPGPLASRNSTNSRMESDDSDYSDCVCKDEFYWPEPGHVCTNQSSILGL